MAKYGQQRKSITPQSPGKKGKKRPPMVAGTNKSGKGKRARKVTPSPLPASQKTIESALMFVAMKNGKTEGETYSLRINGIRELVSKKFLNPREAEITAARVREDFIRNLTQSLNAFLDNRSTRTNAEHLSRVFKAETLRKLQQFGFLGEDAVRRAFNAAISNNAISLNEQTISEMYEILNKEIERQKRKKVIITPVQLPQKHP